MDSCSVWPLTFYSEYHTGFCVIGVGYHNTIISHFKKTSLFRSVAETHQLRAGKQRRCLCTTAQFWGGSWITATVPSEHGVRCQEGSHVCRHKGQELGKERWWRWVVEVYAGDAGEHTECASPPPQGRQNTSTLDHQFRARPSFTLNVCVCCGIRR